MWHEWDTEGVLMEIPEGQRPLGRPGSRWEANIKVDVLEFGWEFRLD
jgi:hypothetical protein